MRSAHKSGCTKPYVDGQLRLASIDMAAELSNDHNRSGTMSSKHKPVYEESWLAMRRAIFLLGTMGLYKDEPLRQLDVPSARQSLPVRVYSFPRFELSGHP